MAERSHRAVNADLSSAGVVVVVAVAASFELPVAAAFGTLLDEAITAAALTGLLC